MRASLPLSLVGGPVALRQIMQSPLGELQHNLPPYSVGVPSDKISSSLPCGPFSPGWASSQTIPMDLSGGKGAMG